MTAVEQALKRFLDKDSRRRLVTAVGVLLTSTGATRLPTVWLERRCRERIFSPSDRIDRYPIAIVPGCGLAANQEPSLTLRDRLSCAATLFERGTVDAVFVSGGPSHGGAHEADAMLCWLKTAGIPEDRILVDRGGLRTRHTMSRAATIFGISSAIICSQRFHLPRSLFLADAAEIEAVGMIADQRVYVWERYNDAREQIACARAVFDVFRDKRRRLRKGRSRSSKAF